jgi:hypothetical protein
MDYIATIITGSIMVFTLLTLLYIFIIDLSEILQKISDSTEDGKITIEELKDILNSTGKMVRHLIQFDTKK